MRKAKQIAALLFLSVAISGCATATLEDGASNAQKRAALCLDAKTAIATADAAMATAGDPEARVYWAMFKAGAQIAIPNYCGE